MSVLYRITRNMKYFFIICTLFSISSIQAQLPTDSASARSMDEVVVTATRTPRLMGNVAIPVSVVNAKTIYQTGSLRLNDILAEQTGIVMVDNFGKGIQVQGLSSEYTLILIDGEPLIGRTGGVLDLSRVTVRNIRKIEVVKGPSSSLYGSEAMGGVINIITDGSGQRKANLALRYGRFNTVDGSFNFSRKFNRTDVTASANYNRSEGYSLKPNAAQKTVEPFWKLAEQISINHQINNQWKIGSGWRRNITYIDNTIEVVNGGVPILSKGFERNDEYNITPYIQFNDAKRWKSTLRGYVTGFKAHQQLDVKDIAGNYNDRFNQLFARVENQTDWQIRDGSSLTFGVGHVRESVASNRYDSMSTKRTNSISYFFAQHEERLATNLTLVGGVRFDANQAYASVWSPKLALHYTPTERLTINFSYGRGFKAPDFRQLYLNFTNLAAGAYSVFGTEVAKVELKRYQEMQLIDQMTARAGELSSLRPEVSGGVNLGFKYQLNATASIQANFFRNDLQNMIVTDVVALKKNGGQIFSYFNLKRALTQGVEVDLEKKFQNRLTARVGYQFLYAADKEVLESIKNGEMYQRSSIYSSSVTRMKLSEYGGLPFRSRHNANLKLTYETQKGLFATLRTFYRSRWGVADIDGNGVINRADEYAKGYVQVNASAGFSVGEKWKIMGGVDNIFNYKDIQFQPGNPGRAGYIDVQFNF